MKIGVVGSGGREAAIIWKLAQDERVDEIVAMPGNGGIAETATCVDVAATDIAGVVAAAKERSLDLVIVMPDDPLVLGMVDALKDEGIATFGPTKAAAQLEGSKAYAKEFMKKYNIPTAAFRVFSDEEEALSYAQTCPLPTVVKASGLALGKGVIICKTLDEVKRAIHEMMGEAAFGSSGETIVIEEFIEGPEISVLAFTDGTTIKPLVSSMDHKRAFDNDEGPNTGGMGCIAPNPFYSKDVAHQCMEEIFIPTIAGCQAEGHPFHGCLFFGLMLTADGPKVLEYNCRFGDPETQTVLPLLNSNLLDILLATENGDLAPVACENSSDASCCVVIASKGYPVAYEKGFPILLPKTGQAEEIFVAGATTGTKAGAETSAAANSATDALTGETMGGYHNKLVTNGGRVINAVAQAPSLEAAIDKAYDLAKQVQFEGATMRTDIGKRALSAQRVS